MKKNQKVIRVMNALRLAISHSMAENKFTTEYCCKNCYCYDCEDKCNDFMVSFYDHNRHHLVSNWLVNSSEPYPYAKSGTINSLAEWLDIDINHLMWDQEDELLHKVRYIRIGRRNFVETEDAYFYNQERGLEYDVYSGSKYLIAYPKRYISSWYSDPDVDKYYLR